MANPFTHKNTKRNSLVKRLDLVIHTGARKIFGLVIMSVAVTSVSWAQASFPSVVVSGIAQNDINNSTIPLSSSATYQSGSGEYYVNQTLVKAQADTGTITVKYYPPNHVQGEPAHASIGHSAGRISGTTLTVSPTSTVLGSDGSCTFTISAKMPSFIDSGVIQLTALSDANSSDTLNIDYCSIFATPTSDWYVKVGSNPVALNSAPILGMIKDACNYAVNKSLTVSSATDVTAMICDMVYGQYWPLAGEAPPYYNWSQSGTPGFETTLGYFDFATYFTSVQINGHKGDVNCNSQDVVGLVGGTANMMGVKTRWLRIDPPSGVSYTNSAEPINYPGQAQTEALYTSGTTQHRVVVYDSSGNWTTPTSYKVFDASAGWPSSGLNIPAENVTMSTYLSSYLYTTSQSAPPVTFTSSELPYLYTSGTH